MAKRLGDGRTIMALYDDLCAYFENHPIQGKKLVDIRANTLDYMGLGNFCEFPEEGWTEWRSSIHTDTQVCLIFEDGSTLEVEIPGEAPIILGYNTADIESYPPYDGTCYQLSTLFQYALGHTIVDVVFHKTQGKMLFPVWNNIDMSAEDDGIKELAFVLDNGTKLVVKGVLDYYAFSHVDENEEELKVPISQLVSDLNDETIAHYGLSTN